MASKYRNQPVIIDGVRFISKAEGARYLELKMLQHGGYIQDLKLQPRYTLMVNDVKICTYVADFRYFDTKHKREVVEDVKGVKTPVYKLKSKLVFALLGIKIVEIA